MTYDELTRRQKMYVDSIVEHANTLGIDANKTDFTRAELRQVSMTTKGKIWIPNWITHDQSRRVARGTFSIPEVMDCVAALQPDEYAPEVDDLAVELAAVN